MEKIKIHELAKNLGVDSKKLLEIAKENGIEVKSHLSSITKEESMILEKLLKGVFGKKSMENKKEKNNEEPVIIRRAVIINDEEDDKKKKEEQKRREQNRKNDVGFVENRRNKDYNIVYREKTVKPLTVSELFGIGKKEEPKKPEVKKEEPKKEEVKKVEVKEEVKVSTEEKASVEEKIVQKPVRTNNYQNRESRDNNRSFNQDRKNNNFGQRRDNNRDGKDGSRDNRDNRNNNFGSKRSLDNRGIDKSIKNIMEVDIPEKENVREYANKVKDKIKANQRQGQEEQKPKKNKKGSGHDFDSDKLNNLKKQNKLSNMFNEGEMLDYYDLSTERGRRGKKKPQAKENRVKQKIFKLTEIAIPETITVKDLATEMKITSGDVIKKLLTLGIMATINNEIDFDTAF